MRAIVLLAYNALRLVTWPFWALWWKARARSARWVALTLRGRLDELPRAQSRLRRLLSSFGSERPSVAEVRQLCERIARDRGAEGLVLRLERLDTGYSVLSSLRAEFARLRRAGKRIVCHLPLGADQRELFLAGAADRVLAMPHAGFSALGPAAARTYIAPLLNRLGVRVVVTAEGRYKTAAEPLARDAMSAPEREQLEAIVRTVHREWIAAVGERPALGESAAEQLFDLGLFGAARARELGVIDGCAYEDELEHELGLSDGQHALPHIRYLRRSGDRPRLFVPLRRRSRIALLRLAGPIAERVRSSGIDLHGTVRTLRRLAGDARIVGVILHIDSPGGSALVSELLHREIERLNREKPVVTWMGNVAASGGYYLACASRAIVAQPTTLTGSIGVVSLRPVAEQLLEHLRIRRDLVGITRYADLHSVVHRPSADEEALLRAETGRFYERFLEVVAHGRKRAVDEIRALAEGRVWSGRDAHRCGLVDALGGYHEARSLLDALLGAEGKQAEREPIVVSLPRRAVAAPLAASAQGAAGLGEFAPLAELLAFGMCRERVLAYALGLPRLR